MGLYGAQSASARNNSDIAKALAVFAGLTNRRYETTTEGDEHMSAAFEGSAEHPVLTVTNRLKQMHLIPTPTGSVTYNPGLDNRFVIQVHDDARVGSELVDRVLRDLDMTRLPLN